MHLIFAHDDQTAVVLDKITRFEIREPFGPPTEFGIYAYVIGSEDAVYLGSCETSQAAITWIKELVAGDGGTMTRGLNP